MEKYEIRRMALIRLIESLNHPPGPKGRGGQRRVAEAIEIDPNYVSRMCYEEGKSGKKRIGEDTVEKLTQAFPQWLGPTGVVFSNEADPDYIPEYVEVRASMGRGVVLRDQPGQIRKWVVTPDWIDKNLPANTGKHNLCIVTGFGDSMRGMFNSGDPLIVDTGVKSVEFDGIYFFRVGEEGFIKRLQRIPGEGILVISQNQDYRDWFIKPEMDFEVFGRVLKIWNGTEY
jgi:phage repressor protein C with HTH and peptisase S24 domain